MNLATRTASPRLVYCRAAIKRSAACSSRFGTPAISFSGYPPSKYLLRGTSTFRISWTITRLVSATTMLVWRREAKIFDQNGSSRAAVESSPATDCRGRGRGRPFHKSSTASTAQTNTSTTNAAAGGERLILGAGETERGKEGPAAGSWVGITAVGCNGCSGRASK